MLIKRVYEVDPLKCDQCGGEMKVVAFIEPPRGDVIEKILRHCGLWDPLTARGPPSEDGWVYEPNPELGEPADVVRRGGAGRADIRRYRRVPGDVLSSFRFWPIASCHRCWGRYVLGALNYPRRAK